MQPKRSRFSIRWPFLAVLAIALLIFSQYQAIHDWWRLRGYSPPDSVVRLADDIGLTPGARRVFYVNHPELQDRESFGTSCSSRGEQTIVLGCYHPVDRGIYLFHVSDERLDGVNQVTAAHEVLHAGYDRLSSSQRTRLEQMLQVYYRTGSPDTRIVSIIKAYEKSEPNDLVNEMHSVFGTEVAQLPSGLEEHYRQYFTDRSKVVRFANDYQEEFTSRQQQVAAYDQQLAGMKREIETNSARLESQEQEINALRALLDRDRNAGNIDEYNANVPVYNGHIDAYNSLINRTKASISSYNQLVSERNQLALQVADLAHSIDSSFKPITE